MLEWDKVFSSNGDIGWVQFVIVFFCDLVSVALRVDVPEAKCFVACSCDNGLPVWTHSEVEHSEENSEVRMQTCRCVR